MIAKLKEIVPPSGTLTASWEYPGGIMWSGSLFKTGALYATPFFDNDKTLSVQFMFDSDVRWSAEFGNLPFTAAQWETLERRILRMGFDEAIMDSQVWMSYWTLMNREIPNLLATHKVDYSKKESTCRSIEQAVLLIPDPEPGEEPKFGITPRYYDIAELFALIREQANNSQAIQFIADMLENGITGCAEDRLTERLRKYKHDPQAIEFAVVCEENNLTGVYDALNQHSNNNELARQCNAVMARVEEVSDEEEHTDTDFEFVIAATALVRKVAHFEELTCLANPDEPVKPVRTEAEVFVSGTRWAVVYPGDKPTDFLNEEDMAHLIADKFNERARVQSEIQSRIYRGEMTATDGDGVQTMKDQG